MSTDLDTRPAATIADEVQRARSDAKTQLDDLEKQVAHREWTFRGIFVTREGSDATWEKTYIQKPLSYTGMLQFTGLLGEKIAEAMAGPDGLTIDGVLGAGGTLMSGKEALARSDFVSMDSFVHGLAKLAAHAPDVIEELQCIWLRIPHADRSIVKEIWSRAPEDGGLRVAEGEEMLGVFLEQNYEEIEDFFVKRLPALRDRLLRLRGTMTASLPSSNGDESPALKPSNSSQPPTPSE